LSLGWDVWPGIAIGISFLVYGFFQAPPIVGFGLLLINLIEPLLAYHLLLRYCGPRIQFRRVHEVLCLTGLAALLCSAVSATLGIGVLWSAGLAPTDHLSGLWMDWWIPNVLSALIFVPLAVTWMSCPLSERDRTRALNWELAAGAIISLAIIVGVFSSAHATGNRHLVFWLFPIIAWLALRQGFRNTVTGIAVISVGGVLGTLSGRGPFVSGSAHSQLQIAQSFLASAAVTGMLLAVAIRERTDAIRLRDDFLSIASHELRTPLSSLKLQLELIQRLAIEGRLAALPQDRLRTLFALSNQQMNQFSTLINDLLDASRIGSGRLVLNPGRVDLNELVTNVTRRFELEFEKSGTRIELNPCVETVIDGEWDGPRLEQVVVNLITNAAKFGAGKPIQIHLGVENGAALFSVRDHGIGIPFEEQSQLFQRFERAPSAAKFTGLGLGLYISRQIVEAHRGKIQVISRPGEGATFTVRLPRQT
jgi:signal transduction histidine kinase